MKAIIKKSKNSKKLASFATYCLKHPDLTFEEALKNWKKLNE